MRGTPRGQSERTRALMLAIKRAHKDGVYGDGFCVYLAKAAGCTKQYLYHLAREVGVPRGTKPTSAALLDMLRRGDAVALRQVYGEYVGVIPPPPESDLPEEDRQPRGGRRPGVTCPRCGAVTPTKVSEVSIHEAIGGLLDWMEATT